MQRLIKRAQKGDNEAFVKLIEMNKQGMYKVAKAYFSSDEDVADAMQETILTCFENLKKLREPKFFKTWLIRILINKCNDLMKESSGYIQLEKIPEKGEMDINQSNAEFIMLMESLEDPYRVVLVLYYGEGFKVKDISEMIGISESAVKTRLKRGRVMVRKLITDNDEGTDNGKISLFSAGDDKLVEFNPSKKH